VMNLYPSMDEDRLYLLLTVIGEQSVPSPTPLIYDTGSAGLTLYAHAIFPSTMFDDKGHLIFPAPQGNLVYNGITVMPQAVEREFGGEGGITLYGYLGFASISFGDAAGELSTSVLPLFLYDTTSSSNSGSGFGDAEGIFGVDDLADEISIQPASTTLPACTAGSPPPCYVVSVLKYLNYSSDIYAGFRLDPSLLQPCNVMPTNSCPPQPMLTVGLTDATESGFSVASLMCPPASNEQPLYYGPNTIQGYPVCEKSIPNGNIDITLPSATTAMSFPGPLLFDTGTIENEIRDSSLTAAVTVAMNTKVAVNFPLLNDQIFSYTYVAGVSDNLSTFLQPTVNNGQNHIGVEYFEYNSFFIDYTRGQEGWKLGAP
jgi:hypothetical protein